MGFFWGSNKGKGQVPAERTTDRKNSSSSSVSSDLNMKRASNQLPRKLFGFVRRFQMKTSSLNIGESKDNIIYCVDMPGSYYGRALLHDGPDPGKDPVIATAEGLNKFLDYSSSISLPDGTKIDFKYNLGNLMFDFEYPVGEAETVEKFQWKATGTIRGKCKLTSLSNGELLATLDEGQKGFNLSTAFEFVFEERTLDGDLGARFPLVALFTGVRCWQSRRDIKYHTGTGGGSSVASAGA
jgi:hypothetical protein